MLIDKISSAFILANCGNTTEGFIINVITVVRLKTPKEYSTLSEKLIALEKDMDTRIQYVADKLEAPIEGIQQICNLMGSSNELLVPEDLFKTELVTGSISGSYVSVWPYQHITDYEYRSSTNCTQDVPIKNKATSGGDWSIGYLSPTNNIVYNTSIPVICEKTVTIFETNTGVMSYRPLHVPTLVKHESIKPLPSRALVNNFFNLSSNHIYSPDDFSSVDTGRAAMQYANDQLDPLNDKNSDNHANNVVVETSGQLGVNLFGWIANILSLIKLIAICGPIALFLVIRQNGSPKLSTSKTMVRSRSP